MKTININRKTLIEMIRNNHPIVNGKVGFCPCSECGETIFVGDIFTTFGETDEYICSACAAKLKRHEYGEILKINVDYK